MTRSLTLKSQQITKKVFFALTSIAALSLMSGCSMFSQDAEDTRPPKALVKISPQLKVSTLWTANVGKHAKKLGLGLAPALRDGVVYVAGHNGVVLALNAETGKQIWSKSTGLALSGGPGVGVGRVVVASNNGDVLSLNIENGQEQWRVLVGGEVLTAPAVSPEQVAVRSANGTLNILSASTGAALWMNENEVPRLSLRGSSTPVITKGVVLSANDSGKVVSYNALDGAVLWERLLGLPRGTTELERLVDIDGNIALSDTSLYAVGYNSRLAKIDARNGNMIWAKEHSSSTGVSLGWKDVYLSNADSLVLALDQESGATTWTNEEYKYRELSAPRATGLAVVVGDFEGFVHFLSPSDGTTIARQRVGKSAVRVPAISANNIVYVQSDDGNVVAFKIFSE